MWIDSGSMFMHKVNFRICKLIMKIKWIYCSYLSQDETALETSWIVCNCNVPFGWSCFCFYRIDKVSIYHAEQSTVTLLDIWYVEILRETKLRLLITSADLCEIGRKVVWGWKKRRQKRSRSCDLARIFFFVWNFQIAIMPNNAVF